MSTQLQAVQTKMLEAASLTDLETAVNAFLIGQGTPAVTSAFQHLWTTIRYADGAANPYLALVVYTGA